MRNRYRIKLAETPAEREQVHRLNYATFVEEIPQHAPNSERRLVDRFDAENEYAIALDGLGEVIGMLALRARRPFSLDQKLERLDDYLPSHRSLCELRLLAVRREHRHRVLLRDLVAFTTRRCVEAGHDLAVISGTTRQLALYRHLGFEPFGPRVGSAEAQYQPMVLSLEGLKASAGNVLGVNGGAQLSRAPARFTPGPVAVSAATRAAMAAEAGAHRSSEFVERVARVRRSLCELTGAGDAALLVGTGTLANDTVAMALRARPGRGLVLANGEFGERLIEQARCAGLEFDELRQPWGEPFAETAIAQAAQRAGVGWIWAVHCETSTGVLNDLEALRRSAETARAALCLDCASSIGAMPVRLEGVWLASASSAKGLAAYPGLAAVLVNGAAPRTVPPAPRYLDLAYWLRRDSVPFTHSSNLVAALDAALADASWKARFRDTARDACWLREALRTRGLAIVAPEAAASPSVASIALPENVPAAEVGAALLQRGFEIAWRSAYLANRNWVQVALMGEYDRVALRQLPGALAQEVSAHARHGERAA
ncbi:MAG: aminotransferase class V-fold PLP-dependent enzyme [Betaproteobacteria bacterium]|nr:aminotransferase class V-fold PLP-dependent enzyme [Betaproteobacteria bacterium]